MIAKENLLETFTYLQQFLTPERLDKIELLALQSSDFILPVMEDVYQFRNAAAVVRSAECCGFHQIVALQKNNPFQPNLKLTKGAENWVEILKLSASINSLKRIKDKGYRIVAVSPEKNAISLPEFEITQPIALCFGTEWEGITQEMLDFADATLSIPMYGFTQSYNVSVATAICLYELKQKLIRNQIPHLLDEEKRLRLKIRWATNSIKSGKEILERFINEKL